MKTKTVNDIIKSWCKFCKYRAMGKVGFFTKHSSSRHTFPRKLPTNTEDDSVERNPTPTVETPAASIAETDDTSIEANNHTLCQGGFLSPNKFIGETSVGLIIRFDTDADTPPLTLRIIDREVVPRVIRMSMILRWLFLQH